MFFHTKDFDFVSTLENGWTDVRAELVRLQPKNFIDWPEKNIYNHGWEVFGLYAFGQRIEENCKLCPKTVQLIEKIPGLLTAGFSSLAPGTYIGPHFGATNAVLRCHLGVVVPDSNCGIRVDKETKNWQEGKCLIFDDTYEHEAWNRSDITRIVLLIDFLRSNPNSTEKDFTDKDFDQEYWLKILNQSEVRL
ncbi:MAG: aspartyl/asparaginyl beta-hydroxylase domain-containing protein [Cylindrospermopsis raciborskii KL1]|jgi:beta-hydroxylase|uniref:aspartyl/asparaginyl beta-hydroxylase domain-containing protein n=1 Tax=Cylindrospermopsis raciborskii TaxID=77022 RepID=UPI001A2F7EED|nr:aspartyl/asparaginyl beta-hydroxylase domain-containing protein [Cylindrospermopsis raciborskii]MBG0742689.1 aspartyl/asparaginyl beta-hydroxylase domain-containing protein [Cylindrospermopsis raciborskii KL1]